MKHSLPILAVAAVLLGSVRADEPAADRVAAARAVTAKIDERLAEHWRHEKIEPAPLADDAEFLRRITLDLAGRVPTREEVVAFAAARSDDGRHREQAALQLVDGPEFALHFARVLDQWIQQRMAGDEAFVEWLRAGLAERRSWDATFRAVFLGPWQTDAEKPAAKFLAKRVKNIDLLTTDATRAFFGVDITCARCHDHPLVSDWLQDHYYGMASFLNRTQETKKNSGEISEKPDGEVTFAAKGGGQKTASMMFLSGTKFESQPKQNRREQLVTAALAEPTFFRRTAVNRAWAWFFGRGLVHPVDQMHSGNPPSVPGLLEWLGDDFAGHGYDLRRLALGVTLSRAYQASSRGPQTPAGSFAAARLRPLTRHQFALSLVLAAGDESFAQTVDPAARTAKYRELEKAAAELLKGLDPTEDNYQASASESLFLANHAAVQKLVAASGSNLTARLQTAPEAERITLAFRTVLARDPTDSEIRELTGWWRDAAGKPNSPDVAGQFVWALLTSAEFRFNH